MANRPLVPRISDDEIKMIGGQLEDWQEKARDKIQNFHSTSYQERLLLTPMLRKFAKPDPETILPWLSGLTKKVCQLSDAEAENFTKNVLATHQGPTATAADGIWKVSVYAWCYEEHSLWKGPTDNKKLCRLARSMLNGFDNAEPIQSRTLDLSDRDGNGLLLNRLLFGDGQSRGQAVLFAWTILLEWVNDPNFYPSPNATRVFRSLLQIPAVFEGRKHGLSNDAHLLECAVKQNVKAQMQQVLNTLEWCHLMTAQHTSPIKTLFSWDSPNLRKSHGQELLGIMSMFLNKYDEHADVKAYDMATPSSKRRRSNRGKAIPVTVGATEEAKEDTVKIGAKRLMAMKNILTKIGEKAYLRWQEHLGWVGVWKFNAMQDATAALDAVWPGSLLPAERRPNELEDMARQVGSKVEERAPGIDNAVLARGTLLYHEQLTPEQHYMMLHKGFEAFEAETLHLTNLNEKLALRPSTEQWLNHRTIVEHWDRTIKHVAMKDMTKEDFTELEDTILNSTVMDQQILDALSGYPTTFHMAMIADFQSFYQAEISQEKEKLVASNNRFWEAAIEKFKLQLAQDQRLIRLTKAGDVALADLLEWLELKSKVDLQLLGGQLSKVFVKHFFPFLSADSWPELAGVFAVAIARPLPIPDDGRVRNMESARNLLIIRADFNTPNARDAMKLNAFAGTMATIAKQVGANNVVLICALATRPKEENAKADVLDYIA